MFVCVLRARSHLSLFGVCREFCPFGKGWWGIWGETLEAVYEVELELLVVRSRPSCFMASSVLWTPATSFHNCCRSVGHMAEEKSRERLSAFVKKVELIMLTPEKEIQPFCVQLKPKILSFRVLCALYLNTLLKHSIEGASKKATSQQQVSHNETDCR